MFVYRSIEFKKYISCLFLKISMYFHKLYLKNKPDYENQDSIIFTNDFWGNTHVKVNNQIFHINEFILSEYFLTMSQSQKDFLIVNMADNCKIKGKYSIIKGKLDFCYDIYRDNILEEKDVHILDLIMMHDVICSLTKENYENIMIKIKKLQSIKKIPNLKVYNCQ